MYVRESNGPLGITDSLPGTARTANAWTWRICERFAAMRHPDRIQQFQAMAASADQLLLQRDYGRNTRDKAAIRQKVRRVVAM
jgi:hypothetical protein